MRVLVASEKGGVGKSFVSANVIAPAMWLAMKRKIRLAEVDASNFTTEFYTKSSILEAETIQVRINTKKVKDDEFFAFLNNKDKLAETKESEEIYEEVDKAINIMIQKKFDIVDVGSNATVVFLNTLIRKELLKYFDYIFLIAGANVQELTLSVKSYVILQENGYDTRKIFFVINKYKEEIEEKLQGYKSYITENNLIRIREMPDYNTRIMTARVIIWDVIEKYKEEALRKELDEAIRNEKVDEIEKIANKLDLLNKAKLFYYTNDFKRLMNLFRDGIKT